MRQCYICGTTQNIQRHHVFNGANRKLSEKYGLCADLCMAHHTGPEGVHFNQKLNLRLKAEFQAIFEQLYDHELWMQLFKKNYM